MSRERSGGVTDPGGRLVVPSVALLVAAGATAALVRAAVSASVEVPGVQGSIQPVLQAALAVAWAVPAFVLVARRRALPFGWLGLLAASTHAAAALLVAVAPANRWCEWVALWLIVVEVPVLGAVVQLFPTGRTLEGWAGFLRVSVAVGTIGVVASAIEVFPADGDGALQSVAGAVSVPLLAFSALGALVPLFVRLRRTVGAERRAVAALFVVLAASVIVPGLVAGGGTSAEVVAQVFTAGQVAFVAVIVLRNRVWGLAPMTGQSLQRVVRATDAERRRIRAELHDGVGAGLTAVRLKVDAAHRLVANQPQRACEMLASASTDIATVLDDVRRLVDGLRPAVLDRISLAVALQRQAEELSANARGLTIAVRDDDGALARLGPGADAAVYRLVTEALTNVVRHSGASRCEVRFDRSGGDVVVDVVDNGSGGADGQGVRGGVGLSSMAARAAEAGGYVVAGPLPGSGFRVRAVLPEASP